MTSASSIPARLTRPPLVRLHAAAIMSGQPSVLALIDGRLLVCTPDQFLAGERGRAILTRSALLDAGVEWDWRGARFRPGSGKLVDAILTELNTELAAEGDPELDIGV